MMHPTSSLLGTHVSVGSDPGNVNASMLNPVCRVCGQAVARDNGRFFSLREMMFGTRETFEYFECSAQGCGCVQIVTVPAELPRFYPSDYRCWLSPNHQLTRNPLARFRQKLKWRVVDYELGVDGVLPRLLHGVARSRKLPVWMCPPGGWGEPSLTRQSAILDVGTGSGVNLVHLAELGFTNLLGIDPFIDAGHQLAPGLAIRKVSLAELLNAEATSTGAEPPQRFDLVMFHHSLEHVPNPGEMLAQARALLKPKGWVMVRVPVAGTTAWQTYGADWVQLDAPRHLCTFTVRGLQALACTAGLVDAGVVFDSTAFQFWGSEQYRRDIPLEDPRSVLHDLPHGVFSLEQMSRWSQEAEALNAKDAGDQAVFFFQATPHL